MSDKQDGATSSFAGDKKAPMASPMARIEQRFILKAVHRVPTWLETYHLTAMTIAWSGGMIGFGYLARENLMWLCGSSLMLFFQWLTDCFDGAVGRHRETGLIKWGFYMDHLLDFIFMWCVFVGYVYIIPPDRAWQIYAIAFLYSGLMVNAFLGFAATNEFRITYFGLGPTEIRILFICFNTAIIIWGSSILEFCIPYLAGLLTLALLVLVHGTHKRLWMIDMRQKTTGTDTSGRSTSRAGDQNSPGIG